MNHSQKKPLFGTPLGDIPYLDTEQMIEVDRAMMEDYNISLIQMMENAGRNLARLARAVFLHDNPRDKNVIVLVAAGKNVAAPSSAPDICTTGARR